MTSNKSYKKQFAKRGFGKESLKQREQQQAGLTMAIVGLVSTFYPDITSVEPDCLEFVQSAQDRSFNANCDLMDLLRYGRFIEFVNAAKHYSLEELYLLFQELEHYFAVIRAGGDLLEAWGDVTPYSVTSQREALVFCRQAGLEAYHSNLKVVHADRFEAESSLSKAVMDATDWELIDCGMMLEEDGTPANEYRDAVFAKGNTEVALRVFHSPRHVECDEDIPEEIQAVITQWTVAA
jgi:hypothetical protein